MRRTVFIARAVGISGFSVACFFSASACLSTSGLTGGGPTDGCGNVQTDVANCGTCGNSCGSVIGGSAACTAGACTATCNAGSGDCDLKFANGCESTLATDDANCGACGKSCAGGTCKNGSCSAVAIQNVTGLPTGVAVDDTGVYYGLNPAGGTTSEIVRVDKDGANAKPIATNLIGVGSVAVDATFVYWVEPAVYASAVASGRILKTAKNGSGGIITIASSLGVDAFAQLTVAAPSIYWSATGVAAGAGKTKGGGVWQCALSGCGDTPTALSNAENVNGAIIDGATFTYASTSAAASGVFTCPFAGCGTTPTQLAGATAGAFQLAFDSATVYWTAADGVHRFDKSSSTTSSILATADTVFAIAVDANNVYFTSTSAGGVESCPLTGCTAAPRVYASALTQPSYLAQDAAALYFSSGSVAAGSISRVSK